MKLLPRLIGPAALLAVTMFAVPASADDVTLTFSGQQSGYLVDPNNGVSAWGAYSGSVTWDTVADTFTWDAQVATSPYGTLNFVGNSGYAVSDGELSAQLDVGIAPSSDPFVINIQIYSPDIVASLLPTIAELSGSITGVTVGDDNGADYFYPVSSEVSSFVLSDAPEPTTFAVLGTGLLLLGLARRRYAKQGGYSQQIC